MFPVNTRYVTNTSHPIIENANEYMFYKKYVNIHSEDRDIIKYPNASFFELDLPQDYLNVSTVTLGPCNFPVSNNIFSQIQNNILFTFQLASYPSLSSAIYYTDFSIMISEGTYNSTTMPIELQNKMNEAVTNYILEYMTQNGINTTAFITSGGYADFVVVFDEISQTLWFGNKTSEFVITNESKLYYTNSLENSILLPNTVETFVNWGLPSYLGFFQSNAYSKSSTTPPRFYYKPLTSGYWLVPQTNTTPVYFLQAPRKLNLIGDNTSFYMDIQLLNTIDELTPFSRNTIKKEVSTNQLNGINNSAFAKIPTSSTSQDFANLSPNNAYKVFHPPAERIRKLRINLRFHDGTPVFFNNVNYTFVLIFTTLVPQSLRNASCIDPTSSQGFNNKFG